MRYEVTYMRSDRDLPQRTRFDTKDDAVRFAKYLTDDIDDLYFGAVTATNVELWAIQEVRHNITEVIHRA